MVKKTATPVPGSVEELIAIWEDPTKSLDDKLLATFRGLPNDRLVKIIAEAPVVMDDDPEENERLKREVRAEIDRYNKH